MLHFIHDLINPINVTLNICVNARHVGSTAASPITCNSNDIIFIWKFFTFAEETSSTVPLKTKRKINTFQDDRMVKKKTKTK